MLQWQTLTIPFGQGLAQQIAPSLVPTGKLLQGDDAWIHKDGSVEHRPGTRAITRDLYGFGTLSDGFRIFSHGNHLYITTPDNLYEYSESGQHWIHRDLAYEATVVRRYQGERGRSTYGTRSDVVYASGVLATAWTDAGASCISIRFTDYDTGAKYDEQQVSLTSVRSWRLIETYGRYIHLVYLDDTGHTVHIATWDAQDLESAVSPHLVASDARAGASLDACGAGEDILLVYETSTGLHIWCFTEYGLTFVGDTDDTWTLSDMPYAGVAIGANASEAIATVMWDADVAQVIKHRSFDYPSLTARYSTTSLSHPSPHLSIAASGGDTTVQRLGVAVSGPVYSYLVWDCMQDLQYNDFVAYAKINNATGVDTAGGYTYHVRAASKPIVHGVHAYIAGYFCHKGYSTGADSATFRFGYLLELTCLPYVDRMEM